jgi:hypothetical protein
VNRLVVEEQALTKQIISCAMRVLPTALSAALILAGCQSPPNKPAPGSQGAQSTRNNSYSLLHQLLDEQKNVSLLRFIKREDSDVKILIKKIASDSRSGAKLLERFAKEDPTLSLVDIGLPPGEVATREAIASTKKKELLGKTGEPFEFSLLLTQTEALRYGSHLAKVASENEPQPARSRALTDMSAEMEKLYGQVIEMLVLKTRSSTNRVAEANPEPERHTRSHRF